MHERKQRSMQGRQRVGCTARSKERAESRKLARKIQDGQVLDGSVGDCCTIFLFPFSFLSPIHGAVCDTTDNNDPP
jgi:hypothetical protein